MRKIMRWILTVAVVLSIGAAVVPGLPADGSGGQADAGGSYSEQFLYYGGGSHTYAAVWNDWRKKGYRDAPQGTNIVIPAAGYTASSPDASVSLADMNGKSDALKWDSGKGFVEYRFSAPASGLYQLAFTYFPLSGSQDAENRADIIRSVLLDGELPFDEARLVTMKRLWKDEQYPPLKDGHGNDIRPKQEQMMEWIDWDVSDYLNYYTEPHRFYLSEGEHVLRLEAVQEIVAFDRFVFKAPAQIPGYADVKEPYKQAAKGQSAFQTAVEAEQMARKSDPVVQMGTATEAIVHPQAYSTVIYNMMGGWRWGRRGAWAEWTFEVPSDGYYSISPGFKQDVIRGRNVYRTISVDGVVPYRELLEYPFGYGGWQGGPLTAPEGETLLFKLSKGRHSLRMSVTASPQRPVMEAIQSSMDRLRELGDTVRMVTGVSNDKLVDKSMNWRLTDYIPDLNEKLEAIIGTLRETRDYLVDRNGTAVESSYSFSGLIRDLQQLQRNPDQLVNSPQRYSTLLDQLAGMSANLLEQPLFLDRIYVSTPDAAQPAFKASVWQTIKNAVTRFVLTFTGDFAEQGREDPDAINVWVQRGRDYVNLIQEMVDQDFTPRTGIKVNVNLMPNAQILILGNAAGIQPDVALGLGEGTPIDFAMRHSLVNLNQFQDYDQVMKRFLPGALIPFHYDQGDWALPEVQSFNLMFYRKDILRKLNATVPETWDDVYRLLPTLQQNRMNFYLPPDDLQPFLYQNGGEYYSADGVKSGLGSPEAFTAFRQLTDFFVMYGLDAQANFFQHFRNGTKPIGIADLNTYLLLTVAAPELTGEWGIAPIPGTRDSQGEIERWAGGGLQAGVIFKSSERQQESWDFLKWWTSDSVQTQFGIDLETLNGLEYRWNTANIQALRQQMWPEEDLKPILEQLRWFKDIPYLPGGYMTDRQYKFAWNRTVVDGVNYRDSLETAVTEIDRELFRKQREFGFIDKQGQSVHGLDVPILKVPWNGSSEGGEAP